jgi:hypothetical protein
VKKLKPQEAVDELLAMGQDSEDKAVKHVIENNDRILKEEEQKSAEALTKLSDHKKNENVYKDALRNEARRRIKEYDIPQGYIIDCMLTSKGMAFGYRHFTSNLWFMKGITISTNPLYDLQGIDRIINEALQEIGNKEKGKDENHLTASGIVLPGSNLNGKQ